eukprot:5762591-Lingulodinium_polyedra.AAC.1
MQVVDKASTRQILAPWSGPQPGILQSQVQSPVQTVCGAQLHMLLAVPAVVAVLAVLAVLAGLAVLAVPGCSCCSG